MSDCGEKVYDNGSHTCALPALHEGDHSDGRYTWPWIGFAVDRLVGALRAAVTRLTAERDEARRVAELYGAVAEDLKDKVLRCLNQRDEAREALELAREALREGACAHFQCDDSELTHDPMVCGLGRALAAISRVLG